MRAAGACVAALAACAPAWADDAMLSPLGGRAGDPARGLALMQERQKSLCVLCHSGPFAEPQLSGTLAPDLAGVGSRLTAGQIRLRIVDMKRINPDTIMPAYLEAAGEDRRVAPAWRGRTILEPQEIEDIVAYLATSRD